MIISLCHSSEGATEPSPGWSAAKLGDLEFKNLSRRTEGLTRHAWRYWGGTAWICNFFYESWCWSLFVRYCSIRSRIGLVLIIFKKILPLWGSLDTVLWSAVKLTPYTVYLIPSIFIYLSKIIYFKPYPISLKIHITFIKFSFIFSIFKAEKEQYVLNTNLLRNQI